MSVFVENVVIFKTTDVGATLRKEMFTDSSMTETSQNFNYM